MQRHPKKVIPKKTLTYFALLALATATHAKEKPNVIFIAVYDMNDWVSVLDSNINTITPNIDRLANSGINFTNAHTCGTYCAPARSAIFTGQFASTTGCYQYQNYRAYHPELVPLQSSFKNAGYNTYGTGKLYNHSEGNVDMRDWTEFHVRTQRQRETGWPMDSWSPEMSLPTASRDEKQREQRSLRSKRTTQMGCPSQRPRRRHGRYDSRRLGRVETTRKARQAVLPRARTLRPHIPNYCPQKYYDLYDRASLPLPNINPDDLEDLPEPMRSKMIKWDQAFHANYIASGLLREAIHSYLACISYADAQIGRVLDTLDASPYADNTIVVLWSDHGFHYGEKGHFRKKELWQRTSHIPFVWRGANVAKGKSTNTTASLIDMYPTFVEMCGLPQPSPKLDGSSLATILKNPEQTEQRSAYLPYLEPNAYAIINEDWRYIKYANDTEELYSVKKDPNDGTT